MTCLRECEVSVYESLQGGACFLCANYSSERL